MKTALVAAAVAAAATGVAVAGGVAHSGPNPVGTLSAHTTGPQPAPAAPTAAATTLKDRTQTVSRSSRRVALKPAKKGAHRKAVESKPAHRRIAPVHHRTSTTNRSRTAVTQGSPKAIASGLLATYGWGHDQFGCLVSLWTRESAWRVDADNPSSSAYGIPQALPGSKMASAGADWRTNPATQIRWGLGYIHDRYGSPCGAWAHSESTGWY